MLRAITTIKNLGVFGNYSQTPGLKAFSRYNVIYGENGAGKTTLSRLFTALNEGAHTEYPLLEFAVDGESGAVAKGQKYARKLRVFNADYVDANIGKFDSPIRPILIVGIENKELVEEVRNEQATYDARELRLKEVSAAIEKATTDKGKIFSAVAKTIGEATSGVSLRGYRKPDAEKDFVRLRPLKSYLDDELEVSRATLQQEQADPVNKFGLPSQLRENNGELVSFVDACAQFSRTVESLTRKTAQEGALKRLVENPEISKWVEEGIKIHRDYSSGACEYCSQAIPVSRAEALADHFGAADQSLKAEIEVAIETGTQLAESLRKVEPAAQSSLYAELRKDYDPVVKSWEVERSTWLDRLAEVNAILADKLIRRSSSIDAEAGIETAALVEATVSLDDILARHNIKTAQFFSAKSKAREILERHYLAQIAEQVTEFEKQIEEHKIESAKLLNGAPEFAEPRSMEALLASVKEKRAKVSSAHAGGSEMTNRLRDFLGRTDLEFQSANDGYRVLRRGKQARRLSEGEKTAIAFLYFIVQLGDHEFDVGEGIVVIDDPISSLDSSAIYQAFACLKNAVRNAKQVFLLTHNFEFLKLLLNWLESARRHTSHYMIVCAETATDRVATIIQLDRLLVEHQTEYQFLFKTLHRFESDGTIASCYHMPNVARKLLETFLEFHYPSSEKLYKKLDTVKFDEDKKAAIYKFTNDNSHFTGKGFDPAIVAESQKNVKYLLEMIKAVAPTHYQGLETLSA
ncbi:wobble nucleotide-excising tRNase [Sphingomonas sp. PvP055]|uniref:AAA family ATPase n=1 Tax=Sphingomonas sp. PvP055 TaxID=3156391 RepID=UPI00339818E2